MFVQKKLLFQQPVEIKANKNYFTVKLAFFPNCLLLLIVAIVVVVIIVLFVFNVVVIVLFFVPTECSFL